MESETTGVRVGDLATYVQISGQDRYALVLSVERTKWWGVFYNSWGELLSSTSTVRNTTFLEDTILLVPNEML